MSGKRIGTRIDEEEGRMVCMIGLHVICDLRLPLGSNSLFCSRVGREGGERRDEPSVRLSVYDVISF